MYKDVIAQIFFRDLNKLTKAQVKKRLRWMKKKIKMLEDEVDGMWLINRQRYSNRFNFRLF